MTPTRRSRARDGKAGFETKDPPSVASTGTDAPDTGPYRQFSDARIKHLEVIQDVVSRLGNNGFIVKGWCLTVAGALFGFAVNSTNAGLAIIAITTTVMFWGLDTYFLRCERLFRHLYDQVRELSPQVPPFFMAATSPDFTKRAPSRVTGWRTNATRPALLPFYSTIIIVAVLLASLIAMADGPQGAGSPIVTASPAQSGPGAPATPTLVPTGADSSHP